ncbi:MAG: NAD(P)/FAD-dependent oxidoreductase [Armatimonadetes bacterium]|nr:NAD(P)/FAD-dependent oxidoreductase [Armatimonadota bacterium]
MPQSPIDVTVIGGGPVGLFAAFYAGLRGMSVRVVDSLSELGGQLTALYPEKYVYDMPGFPKVLAKELAQNLIHQAMQFEPEIVLEEVAETLLDQGGYYDIVTATGKSLPTQTIIIAAGNGSFSPTKIGIDREEEFHLRGDLFYGVKHLETFRGRNVAIIGGGDSAFDWALALHDIAKSIHLVHRRDQFRAHEDTVEKVRATTVQFHLWCAVKELKGDPGLSEIIIENSQTKESAALECDSVIVNIGYKSSLGPLKDWGLEIEKNQIRVDHQFRTNLPRIYAVGDVCSFDGKIKLIATGVGEAATAVCMAKMELDPSAKLFPGHSSDMELPAKN